MERMEKIVRAGEEFFSTRIKETMEAVMDVFQEHQEAIEEKFASCLSVLFELAECQQQSGEKGALQYISISYLLSGRLTGNDQFRIDLYDEQFYLDQAFTCCFFELDFLFERYRAEMEQFKTTVKKEIPRVEKHELDLVGERYRKVYYFLAGYLWKRLLPVITKVKAESQLFWAEHLKIIYGGYMDQFSVLDELCSQGDETSSHLLSFDDSLQTGRSGTAGSVWFQVQWEEDGNHLPQILNWYGTMDVRHINKGKSHLLPSRVLLYIESYPETLFSDVISYPWFLVSELFKETVDLYQHDLIWKEVILVDAVYERAELYYLPILPEVDCLSEQTVFYNDHKLIKKAVLDEEKLGKEPIFRIKEKKEVILRLDLAESLLRRGVRGIVLNEVEVERSGGRTCQNIAKRSNSGRI